LKAKINLEPNEEVLGEWSINYHPPTVQ